MNSDIIRLRAIEPEDLDELYLIENDTELWRVGNTSVPYSRYILHQYIANSSADIYADKQVRLVIENNDGEMAGLIDVINYEPQHGRAEVGIVIKQQFRRRGYASAAIKKIIEIAKTWNICQFYAIVASDNYAGKELFVTSGFCETAVLSKWLCDNRFYKDAILLQYFL